MRLRRTMFFANGYDFERIQAGIDAGADAIQIELEDLCPLPLKEAAREGAVKVLREWDFKGAERIVRINAPDTELGKKDLEAILPAIPDAIRLPKCETPEYILEVDKILTEFEASNNLEHNQIELLIILETPIGILRAYELCSCCKRITSVACGMGDLTSAMGVDRDMAPGSTQFLFAKQLMIMAAKAAGIGVTDTTVICQPDQMEKMNEFISKDTEEGKKMGFTGRSVSMIPHIKIINDVFAPTEKEIEHAKCVVEGYDAAVARGEKEVFINGAFIDPPIVEKAQRVLDFAEQIKNKK